jgi:threonine/homoserine/homoserine lactone efflux protein
MHLVEGRTALAFAATATALVVTPGAGFVLFSSTMFTRGRRAALALGAGIIAGTIVLAAIAVTVYPRVVGRVASIRELLRIAGGSYLLYLGARNVVRGLRARRGGVMATDVSVAGPLSSTHGLVTEGATSALTNPGLLVMYLLILPSFLVSERQWQPAAATLAAVHVSIATLWYALLFVALGRAQAKLVDPRWQSRIAMAAGGVLFYLGTRILVS